MKMLNKIYGFFLYGIEKNFFNKNFLFSICLRSAIRKTNEKKNRMFHAKLKQKKIVYKKQYFIYNNRLGNNIFKKCSILMCLRLLSLYIYLYRNKNFNILM